MEDRLFSRHDRLPLAFRWIGGEMVVTQNQAEGAAIPAGSVVKTIDGVRAAAIRRQMLPRVRADGGNDGN